jgi:hypothetical protein
MFWNRKLSESICMHRRALLFYWNWKNHFFLFLLIKFMQNYIDTLGERNKRREGKKEKSCNCNARIIQKNIKMIVWLEGLHNTKFSLMKIGGRHSCRMLSCFSASTFYLSAFLLFASLLLALLFALNEALFLSGKFFFSPPLYPSIKFVCEMMHYLFNCIKMNMSEPRKKDIHTRTRTLSS